MLKLTTDTLELRGIKNCKSKKDNLYYLINCENPENGDPCQFYCNSMGLIPPGLKKGDKLKVIVGYNHFKELVVLDVQKVG